MSISHDSVNRFLNRESYTGQDLCNKASPTLNLKGSTLRSENLITSEIRHDDEYYSKCKAVFLASCLLCWITFTTHFRINPPNPTLKKRW